MDATDAHDANSSLPLLLSLSHRLAYLSEYLQHQPSILDPDLAQVYNTVGTVHSLSVPYQEWLMHYSILVLFLRIF